MMTFFKTESAEPEVIETIVRIHHDAVHQGEARQFYGQEILNDWSPPVTKQRIRDLKQKMSESHSVGVIGCLNGEPAGFGILDLYQERIGAIYVKAAFTGRGIGKRLLQELEKIALQKGHEKLKLDSSLNAKTFYQKHGYTQLLEGFFQLPTGRQMACVEMSKTLTSKSSKCGKTAPLI